MSGSTDQLERAPEYPNDDFTEQLLREYAWYCVGYWYQNSPYAFRRHDDPESYLNSLVNTQLAGLKHGEITMSQLLVQDPFTPEPEPAQRHWFHHLHLLNT